MKNLRITKHARQRLNERLPISITEVRKMFDESDHLVTQPSGEELHSFKGFIFVVKRHLGKTPHLITVIKKTKIATEGKKE